MWKNARDNVGMHISMLGRHVRLDIEPMNKIRNIRGFSTFVVSFFVRERVEIGRDEDNSESGSLHACLFYMCKSAQ